VAVLKKYDNSARLYIAHQLCYIIWVLVRKLNFFDRSHLDFIKKRCTCFMIASVFKIKREAVSQNIR